MVRKLFLNILLICLTASAALAADHLSLDISPESGSTNDEFIFTVTVSGTDHVDYPVLSGGDDFDISLIGPQQSVQIINGVVSQQVSFAYRLLPRKAGSLKTPAASAMIEGRKESASPLTVLIKDAATIDPADSSKETLLLHDISAKSVYQGEQVVSTVKLASRVPVHKYQIQDPTLDGFWHAQFGNRESSVEVMNGYKYRTYSEHAALFPLRTGTLEVSALTAKATVTSARTAKKQYPFGSDLFDDLFFDFGARVEDITLRSPAMNLEVKPLPARPANFQDWGLGNIIVGDTTIALRGTRDPVKVGESKTIQVEVTSLGNIAPIQQVLFSDLKGAKVYQETPESTTEESAGMALFKKVFKVSVVPTKPGTLTIDSLKLGYFDPQLGEYKVAESAPLSFQVTGDPALQSEEQETPTQSAAPEQPSQTPAKPSLKYEEESGLQRLAGEISPSLILLVLSAIFVAGLGAFLLLKLSRGNSGRREIRKALATALTLEELDNALRRLFTLRFQTPCSALSSEQIKALLKDNIKNSDLLFLAQRLLDQVSAAKYADKKADLSEIREKAIQLEKRI